MPKKTAAYSLKSGVYVVGYDKQLVEAVKRVNIYSIEDGIFMVEKFLETKNVTKVQPKFLKIFDCFC